MKDNKIDGKQLIKKYVPILALIIYAAVAFFIAYFCVTKLNISVVVTCIMVVFEVLMAVLLNRIPLWVHGLNIIAQIVVGVITSKHGIMALMAIIYILAVLVLFIWDANEQN